MAEDRGRGVCGRDREEAVVTTGKKRAPRACLVPQSSELHPPSLRRLTAKTPPFPAVTIGVFAAALSGLDPLRQDRPLHRREAVVAAR